MILDPDFDNQSAWSIKPAKDNTGTATISNGLLTLNEWRGTVSNLSSQFPEIGSLYSYRVVVDSIDLSFPPPDVYATFGGERIWGTLIEGDGAGTKTGVITASSIDRLVITASNNTTAVFDSVAARLTGVTNTDDTGLEVNYQMIKRKWRRCW